MADLINEGKCSTRPRRWICTYNLVSAFLLVRRDFRRFEHTVEEGYLLVVEHARLDIICDKHRTLEICHELLDIGDGGTPNKAPKAHHLCL